MSVCVRIYIKINAPFGWLWSKSVRVTISLSANLGVFALSETLDKERKEMTAGNNKNSIKKTRHKKATKNQVSIFFEISLVLNHWWVLRCLDQVCRYWVPFSSPDDRGDTALSQKTTHTHTHTNIFDWGMQRMCSLPTSTPLCWCLGSLLMLSNTVPPGKDLHCQSPSCQPRWPTGPRTYPAIEIKQPFLSSESLLLSCPALNITLWRLIEWSRGEKTRDNKQAVWKWMWNEAQQQIVENRQLIGCYKEEHDKLMPIVWQQIWFGYIISHFTMNVRNN